MMKLKTLFGVAGLLCLYFSLSAQQVSVDGRLKPGDKLPEVVLANYYAYGQQTRTNFSLNDLKGKAIILDFFATWCGSCLAKFPHNQALQSRFGDRLVIVLVNTSGRDTNAKVDGFMREYYAKHPDFTLSYANRDLDLERLFPCKMLPHYVWVGADGVVKAITGGEEVTERNVALLIEDVPLMTKLKTW